MRFFFKLVESKIAGIEILETFHYFHSEEQRANAAEAHPLGLPVQHSKRLMQLCNMFLV